MLVAVESASPDSGKHHGGAGSILVVDDERASGELVAALLKSQGYAVRMASDGREACAIIEQGGVDLLLLDLMMCKMDGVEVCAHIRTQLGDAFLPIVITTSLTDRESRIRAKEAGADDVLVKPLDGLELLVRIESLLATRAQLGSLMRERDRAQAELNHARTVIQAQQRTLRQLEGSGEMLRLLVERQRRQFEGARKRLASSPDAREELTRFAQLTAELSQVIEQIAGAATGTIVRLQDNVADGADERAQTAASK